VPFSFEWYNSDMSQLDWLINFFQHHDILIYGLIAIFSCIEGPILAMLGGVLLHLGYLYFIPLYAALIVGDLLGDTLWYIAGRHLGEPFVRKWGGYFSIRDREIQLVKKIFHKYHNRILILSKITMGFGFAIVTLFTAGMIKIPFRKYILLNLAGQFVWSALLLGVGYLFGNLYLSVNGILGKMTLIGLIVVAFIALIGYGKYVKDRMTRE
jgi:membrane protein DedA with SNARE-associated domain